MRRGYGGGKRRKQGDRSGEVKLQAPRVNGVASYKWQRSTEENAETLRKRIDGTDP